MIAQQHQPPAPGRVIYWKRDVHVETATQMAPARLRERQCGASAARFTRSKCADGTPFCLQFSHGPCISRRSAPRDNRPGRVTVWGRHAAPMAMAQQEARKAPSDVAYRAPGAGMIALPTLLCLLSARLLAPAGRAAGLQAHAGPPRAAVLLLLRAS